jgi:hypothetical protein
MQNRIEFKKKDDYFIRVYATREDAGKSYDPYATSLRLLDEARSDENWSKVYIRYWQDSINDRIDGLGYPGLVMNPNWDGDPATYWLPYDYEGQQAWLEEYNDSLSRWHSMVEQWTNQGNAGIIGIDTLGIFAPGTARFNEAFERITSLKNNEGEGGTRFYDRSALYHIHGEKQFTFQRLDRFRVGGNYRLYTPNSDGTIFSDTAGTRITNSEFGLYAGLEEKMMEDPESPSSDKGDMKFQVSEEEIMKIVQPKLDEIYGVIADLKNLVEGQIDTMKTEDETERMEMNIHNRFQKVMGFISKK